jgi:hypothetical protein
MNAAATFFLADLLLLVAAPVEGEGGHETARCRPM